MPNNIRLAIVFDNFGPYHVARMAGAARYCDVVAVEVSPSNSEYAWVNPDLPDNLQHVTLATGEAGQTDAATFARLFDERLAPLKLNCVAVPGWSSLAALTLTRWCVERNIPVIGMSETNGWDFQRSWPTEFAKKGVVRHYAAALVTSDSQAQYMQELGLAADAVFRGYNAVDNAYFASATEAVRASGAMPSLGTGPMPEAWRNRYFLASNRFIEKKNLPTLLRSYATFRQGRSDDSADWPLVMLGDGEMRAELEALTAELGLGAHVHYPGFRQIDELPAYYATAGAFVHVSTTEQWGLVINEALASGLPAIVSRRCGCAEVLIADDVNGLLIDPYDGAGITDALERMADPHVRKRLAGQAAGHVADWGPDRFGTGMRDAADYAMRQLRVRPNLIDRQCLKMAISRLA